MPQEITALRFQKRNKNRVNVYIDGAFAFGLAAIEAARLKVGQTLSEEEIAHLKQADDVERAHEKALNFLSYRPRSTAEVRRNLRKKDLDDDVINAAIGRLERAGLLDDLAFAQYWVDNRKRFNPRGPRALRHELRRKGVSHAIIDEALVNLDEGEAVRQAAETGARKLARYESKAFRRKLTAYLARRGFTYSVIKPVVQELVEAHRSEAPSNIESKENDNA